MLIGLQDRQGFSLNKVITLPQHSLHGHPIDTIGFAFIPDAQKVGPLAVVTILPLC
jgi:hypothetical protein